MKDNKAVYSTAPATQGLLNTRKILKVLNIDLSFEDIKIMKVTKFMKIATTTKFSRSCLELFA